MDEKAERAAFEAWMREDSTTPLDRDEHGYRDMVAALMWHAYRAALAAAPAPAPLSKADRVRAIVDAGPYPGMSAAFDTHMGAECWTDPAYRQDAATWAAAWKAAVRATAAPAPAPLTDDERAELDRLRELVNTPELHDFARAVVLEAAHQRERWGSAHDAGKAPQDWFWLLGYLGGKALAAHAAGNTEKALHHTISSAAALANWHAAIAGASTTMRPGIDPAAHGIGTDAASAPHPDAADAERYRWLRKMSDTWAVSIRINGNGSEISETLDAAIDAARAQARKG